MSGTIDDKSVKHPAERAVAARMPGRVIGHDLANLMLAIDGNLVRLRTALASGSAAVAEDSMRVIASAVQRSRDLVDELAGQQAIALPMRQALDLRKLAAEAAALHRPHAEAIGVSIAVEGPDGTHVSADRTQLTRVMINLIGNAVRACRGGGKVAVSVGADAEGPMVRVCDDGVGMTPEQLVRAFDPGFTTKADGRGGLGLAISYLIVDAHGGHLSLESAPGKGTQITIRLPASAI